MASRKQQRERRERVLERAAEVGDEQAAAEAGIEPATLRKWRGHGHEVPEQPEPSAEPELGPDAADAEQPRPLTDIERMRRNAQAAHLVAGRAIDETDRLLKAARASDARNAAAAGGIWADKAARWDELIAQAEDRQVRLAHEQARELAERWNAALDALGIDRSAVADVTRAALRGEPVDPAVAERARAAVREMVAAEIRVELEAELAARADAGPRERLQLPPPRPHPDAAERDKPEPMVGPRRVIKAARERVKREKPKPERPKPKRRAQPGVEEVPIRVGDKVDVFKIDTETGELLDPEVPNWQ